MTRTMAWMLAFGLAGCDHQTDSSDPSIDSDTSVDTSIDSAETDLPEETDLPDTDLPEETDLPEDTDLPADTDDTDVESITDCGVSLAAPPNGDTCAVATAGTAGWLLRGDVLTPDGALRNGSVLIGDDGKIACVGCDCSEDPAFADASVVDCPDGVISPGFINLHDHITYSEGSPVEHGETRYDHRHGWRGVLSTPANSGGTNGVRWGEIRHLMSGTTSVAGSGGEAGLVRNVDRSNGLEGLTISAVSLQTFPLGDSNETFHPDCAWNYSNSEAQAAERDAFVPHISEGINSYAAEEFRCTSDGFAGEDLTESNTAHVGGIGLTAQDYATMAHDGTTLIWSPRSNISLYGQTAQVALFHRLGGNLALGTDWAYTGSINLGRELACASYLNETHYGNAFSSQDLWRMATEAGARGVHAEDQIGSLAPGLEADIAVFASGDQELWEAAISAGTTEVALVLRSGEALYGEAAVVDALHPNCEPLDVCGEERSLCAVDETGSTYDQIHAAVPNAYPAFSCDPVPADEPTCEPTRPDEYDGITADDNDGDGLPNVSDLCPDLFDPIRPMDEEVQPDLDDDGIGDACDPTPLPEDVDGDGFLNDLDVCPWIPDDQADADNDAKGDVCDPCPDTANPDRGCP